MSDRIPCPIDGCRHLRLPSHAMCRTCWAEVPRELQREVWRTWRARTSGASGARAAHLQALENAEAVVEGRDSRDLFARRIAEP